jgi:uncharacterized OB-fold protein
MDVDPQTQPYWDAAGRGQLVLPRCLDCRELFWYPRGYCPHCASTSIEWTPASGAGVVYTFSIVRRAGGEWASRTPYVLSYITLDGGPTVMANVVGVDPDHVSIGMPVQAVFEQSAASEPAVLRFRPAESGS